ncbi:unnamed protein product [Lupinus luteus]|uniref:DUF4283 domain-containing protein n=1 Tax=Lupinus luteus TaxID=3873 RepID=A0AAV1WX95_LUPLU
MEVVEKWTGLEYKVQGDDLQKLKNNFIGEFLRMEDILIDSQTLIKEGFLAIKVIPLGVNLILFEEDNQEEFVEMMNLAKERWGGVFVSLRRWSPEDVSIERLAWFKLYGIPAHAWNVLFFSLVAESCGKFVKIHEETKNKKRLDIGRILITTDVRFMIDNVVVVKIDGRNYEIRMVEEDFNELHNHVPAWSPEGGFSNSEIAYSRDDGLKQKGESIDIGRGKKLSQLKRKLIGKKEKKLGHNFLQEIKRGKEAVGEEKNTTKIVLYKSKEGVGKNGAAPTLPTMLDTQHVSSVTNSIKEKCYGLGLPAWASEGMCISNSPYFIGNIGI